MNKDSKLEFRQESNDGRILYTLLPNERLEEVLKVLTVAFYPYECACIICTKVAENPKAVAELNELCKECIKDGISIVAIQKDTNQIVGVAINKIQKKKSVENEESLFETFYQTRCKEEQSRAMMNFMIECDRITDVFKPFNTDKVLECMFLCVLPGYRKQSIGLELVRCTVSLGVELAKNFDGPPATVAQFTSRQSQAIIGTQLGFQVIQELPYDQFKFRDVPFSETLRSANQRSILLVGKVVCEKSR